MYYSKRTIIQILIIRNNGNQTVEQHLLNAERKKTFYPATSKNIIL